MRRRNRFTRVYFKYLTVLVIGLMVVLGVVLFAKTRGTGEETLPESESAESSSAEDSSTESVESTELPTTEEPTEPTISAVDSMKVTELIARYYQAKVDDNVAELNYIVDSDTDYNDAQVLSEAQFVDRYDDFNTYVMKGADDSSYIVYVKYNIFFKGISTGASSLNHFYVIRREDDTMVIYDRPLSAEQQKVMTETENSPEIVRLKAQVEEELAAACEANTDLKYLMAKLNHTTVEEMSGSTAATETESASAEETEPASESVEDSSTSGESTESESASEGSSSESADAESTEAGSTDAESTDTSASE